MSSTGKHDHLQMHYKWWEYEAVKYNEKRPGSVIWNLWKLQIFEVKMQGGSSRGESTRLDLMPVLIVHITWHEMAPNLVPVFDGANSYFGSWDMSLPVQSSRMMPYCLRNPLALHRLKMYWLTATNKSPLHRTTYTRRSHHKTDTTTRMAASAHRTSWLAPQNPISQGHFHWHEVMVPLCNTSVSLIQLTQLELY